MKKNIKSILKKTVTTALPSIAILAFITPANIFANDSLVPNEDTTQAVELKSDLVSEERDLPYKYSVPDEMQESSEAEEKQEDKTTVVLDEKIDESDSFIEDRNNDSGSAYTNTSEIHPSETDSEYYPAKDTGKKESTESANVEETDVMAELKDGWNIIEGQEIYIKNKELYSGWISDKNNKCYVKEGKRFTGWLKENERHFYVKEGIPYIGWHKMGEIEKESREHWSYFGNDGVLRTGWQEMGQGTTNPDGKNKRHWSYFGSNGWLRTGWVQLGKGTSEPDGNKEKHWSYFGSNGWLRTGWQEMGQGTTNPDGKNKRHWSYFGSNGWLRTGWLLLGKGTSEPDNNSAPHWSYFGDNGWLSTGIRKIAGMTSTFNDYGWLRRYETVTPHYNQYAYGYPTGCGGTSLFMALQYKGMLRNWSLPQFFGTMPYSNDGNPNNGFVGSPTNYHLTPTNRAIYPAALARWGARYGDVTNISGCTFDYMINEVRKGNPVVALATWNLSDYAITQYSWGKYRDYNHHFFVLVGYDYATDRYKVMDALISTGDGSKWITGASFRKVWNGIKGAVVVR